MGKKPQKAKPDELVEAVDGFAKELMTLARYPAKEGEEALPLQTRLDVFKAAVAWVGVKHRVIEADPQGGTLDEFRTRLRGSAGSSRGGTARGPHPGGDPVVAARARYGREANIGNGGPALEAVKRALPSANAGDDDGAGDGAER